MTFVVSPDCGIVLKAGNRHLPPLKRGGVDNASNVQWQTIEAAKTKNFRTGVARAIAAGPRPYPPPVALSVAGRPVASGDGAGVTGGGEAAGASGAGEAARGSRSRCRDDVVTNMT